MQTIGFHEKEFADMKSFSLFRKLALGAAVASMLALAFIRLRLR